MMTLREIIEDAEQRLSTLRNPDISEAREIFNKIFPEMQYERIIDLEIFDGNVHIETSYSCDGRSDSSSFYTFPVSLLYSENFERSVELWHLQNEINSIEKQIESTTKTVEYFKKQLAEKFAEQNKLLDK